MSDQQLDPSKCQHMDEAMNEQCMRLPLHEGPHDALGEPEDVAPEPVEDLVLSEPPVAAPEPQEAPARVYLDLNDSAPATQPFTVADRVQAFTEYVERATGNRVLTAGEMVDYAVGSTVMPNQQTGAIVPYLSITLFIPGMTVGERIHITGMIDNFFLDQDSVDSMVSDMVGSLVIARRDHAAQIKAAANGLITGQ